MTGNQKMTVIIAIIAAIVFIVGMVLYYNPVLSRDCGNGRFVQIPLFAKNHYDKERASYERDLENSLELALNALDTSAKFTFGGKATVIRDSLLSENTLILGLLNNSYKAFQTNPCENADRHYKLLNLITEKQFALRAFSNNPSPQTLKEVKKVRIKPSKPIQSNSRRNNRNNSTTKKPCEQLEALKHQIEDYDAQIQSLDKDIQGLSDSLDKVDRKLENMPLVDSLLARKKRLKNKRSEMEYSKRRPLNHEYTQIKEEYGCL